MMVSPTQQSRWLVSQTVSDLHLISATPADCELPAGSAWTQNKTLTGQEAPESL